MLLGVMLLPGSLGAAPVTVIDDSTLGFYNDAIGAALDGTSSLFPAPGGDDPTIDPAPEPDLSSASSVLGDWLSSPESLNANWSGPQAIPSNWASSTETAIVYEINAGGSGLENLVVEIGVNNGAFIWLDGIYQSGQLLPGGVVPGELTASLGNLTPGIHYLQILREDHSSAGNPAFTGFTITATVPEPSTALLIWLGLAGLSCAQRRHAARPPAGS